MRRGQSTGQGRSHGQGCAKIEIDIYSELTEKTSDTNYTLASIVFKEINYNITRISSIAAAKSSVILTSRTNDYSNIKNKVYTVNPDYSNSTLKYTSLTLNDLEYNYAGNHRLFVRNNLVVEQSFLYSRARPNSSTPSATRPTSNTPKEGA